MAKQIDISDLDIFYGDFKAVSDVSMTINPQSVTAFIGPSGCGKSTLLRTINRMHEVVPGASVRGNIKLDGIDLYGRNVDPVAVRRTIGMVFQRRSEEHTSELQSRGHLVCRLLLEKKKILEILLLLLKMIHCYFYF